MTFISYICNGAVIDWNGSGGQTTLKSSRFQPSNYLFFEADERIPFFLNDGSSPPSQGLTIRHDKGGLVAAFDCHAEWMSYIHYYSLVREPPFPTRPSSLSGPFPMTFGAIRRMRTGVRPGLLRTDKARPRPLDL